MSLVRFAMVCDKCHQRQPEYEGWLTCRDCGDDVCESCCAEYDPDPPGSALCKQCAALEQIEQIESAQLKVLNAAFDIILGKP